MIRSSCCLLLSVLASAAAAESAAAESAAAESAVVESVSAPKQRNVLFIIVDDMRPSIGAFNFSLAHTPNMDRLSASGTTFKRAYVQYAFCAPSRNSFMSGRRPVCGTNAMRCTALMYSCKLVCTCVFNSCCTSYSGYYPRLELCGSLSGGWCW